MARAAAPAVARAAAPAVARAAAQAVARAAAPTSAGWRARLSSRVAALRAGVRPPAERHTRWWHSVVAVVLAAAVLATTLVLSTRPALSEGERDAAVGSARTSLESLLSYSGVSFDAHVAEVTPRLASPFKEEFAKVAATEIKPMAVKNGATVLAKVYEVGVMGTTGTGAPGSTVRVLAFVNQATTTTARKTPAIDQNRVIATMTKVDGRWLISRLEAF